MDYRKASIIRGRKLSDVIAAEVTSGKSIKESFKAGVSEKFRAHVTGIKEKFDPLNIAKELTGGSNLAPAILGRLTGRNQRDIRYFSQNVRLLRGISAAPGRVAGGQSGKAGGVSNAAVMAQTAVLNRIFNFLKRSQDNEHMRFESMKNLKEEQELERNKRHEELLKAITGSSSVFITGKKEEEDEDSPISKIMDYVQGALSALEWARIIGTRIGPMLLRFFLSPQFAVLAGMFLAGYGLAELSEYLTGKAKAAPDLNKPTSAKEAEALLTGSREQIEKTGGEEYARKVIEEVGTQEKVKALIAAADNPTPEQKVLIEKYGGKEGLQKQLAELQKEGDVQLPTPRNILENMATEVPPRPEGDGARAKSWDRKFKKDYNPSGVRKDIVSQRKQEQETWLTKNAQAPTQKTPMTAQQIEAGVKPAEKVEPRPTMEGVQAGKVGVIDYAIKKKQIEAAQKEWDKNYGDKYDAQGNLKQTATPEPAKAAPVESFRKDVAAMTSENEELNLRKFLNPIDPMQQTVVSKQDPGKITKRIVSPDLFRLDRISVRNPEQSFRRMIYYSTRVV